MECLELHDDKFVQIYSMETEESVSFVFEETTSFLRVHRVYTLEYSGFFFPAFHPVSPSIDSPLTCELLSGSSCVFVS